jgi:hypothetical protein
MPFSHEFEKEIVQIENTELQLGGGEFALSGLYEGFNDSYLFLKLDGKNTNLQTILAFCPQEVRKELSAYKSRGKVYFNAEIDGKLANNKMPSIQVGFGFSNVSISHPDFSQQIENFFASGEFNNGRLQNLATSTLKLDSLSGNLASNRFQRQFPTRRFTDFLSNPEHQLRFGKAQNQLGLFGEIVQKLNPASKRNFRCYECDFPIQKSS